MAAMARIAGGLLLLASLMSCHRAPPPELARCTEQTGGELRHEQLSVRTGSTVTPTSVEGGAYARCSDGHAGWMTFRSARTALQRVPAALRPRRVEIHLDPATRGSPANHARIGFHAPSRTLILRHDDPAPLDQSVWLHELGHLRSAGARPSPKVARKVMRAVEEAVADYYAAAVLGSPQLGGTQDAGRGTTASTGRDLTKPPPASVFDWVSLGLPRLDVDPHKLGWQLAAQLWKLEPHASTLLEDLVAALANETPWPADARGPAAVANTLLARCPRRSRARLSTALRHWIPEELWSG
jgi:hypothetical protein